MQYSRFRKAKDGKEIYGLTSDNQWKPVSFEEAKKPEQKAAPTGDEMTCPKCDYAGEPDGDGNCPKCGTPMEPTKPEAEKAGRVLSAANEERLRNIQATLGEILEQVAPPKAEAAPEAQAGVPPADAAPLNRPDGSLVASAQGLLVKLFDAGNTDLAVLNRVRCAVQATIEAIEKKRRREAVAKLFSRNARPPGQHPSL